MELGDSLTRETWQTKPVWRCAGWSMLVILVASADQVGQEVPLHERKEAKRMKR